MNTKILFISSNLSNFQNGGALCSERNYRSICDLFGSQNVSLYKLTPFSMEDKSKLGQKIICLLSKVRDLLTLRVNGSSLKIEKEIIKIIDQNKIDIVFIDSSLNGFFVKRLKKNRSKIKIVSFAHNCELIFTAKQLKTDFTAIFRLMPVFINEFLTAKHSDKVIVLNKRDSFLFNKYYITRDYYIIPISLTDKFCSDSVDLNSNRELTLLFVGSYFYANKLGVEWFIKNVLPKVDAKLIIVGKDMNKLLQNSSIKNISNWSVFSSVLDIADYYLNADAVIAPIFTGGGMKVKIAEALMYGKIIIGTKEAFEGYDKVETMIECHSSVEFMDKINHAHYKKFSEISRTLFDEKYSYSSTLVKFSDLLL
jgi:hypothetical protein